MNEKSLAIFDSGVGGLTVLKEVKRLLPNEHIIYFGDTKRVPYGPRTRQEISKFSLEIVEFLKTKDIKMLIIACNTITSNSIDEIRQVVDLPVIGVIEPGIKMAISQSKNKHIGLIATEGTIKSQVYQNNIETLVEGAKVFGVACPKLVEIAERGIDDFGEEESLINIKNSIGEFKDFNMDTLILGCTHFPVIEDYIKIYTGPINIIDPALETAKEVKKILLKKSLLNKNVKNGNKYYYVTKDKVSFKRVGERILGEKMDHIFEMEL